MAVKKEETEQEKNKMKKDSQYLEYERNIVKKDLNEAIVPMENAQKIIDKISKDDITTLKSFKNVSSFKGTKIVMEMVMTYMEEKWDKKGDGWWKQSQKILADINFLQRVKTYNKDSIKQSIIDSVGKMLQNENFNPDKIKNEAAASAMLASWAAAIHEYSLKRKIVKPKEEKLRLSEETFEKKNAELKAKVEELQAIENQLLQMQVKLEETQQLIKDLDANKELSEKRLQNAEKLIDLLGEEGQRWEESVAEMTYNAKF
jgi:dynein heavy chain